MATWRHNSQLGQFFFQSIFCRSLVGFPDMSHILNVVMVHAMQQLVFPRWFHLFFLIWFLLPEAFTYQLVSRRGFLMWSLFLSLLPSPHQVEGVTHCEELLCLYVSVFCILLWPLYYARRESDDCWGIADNPPFHRAITLVGATIHAMSLKLASRPVF